MGDNLKWILRVQINFGATFRVIKSGVLSLMIDQKEANLMEAYQKTETKQLKTNLFPLFMLRKFQILFSD